MSSDDASERDVEPPPGFEVMRSVEIDPLFGAWDRWAYRGSVGAMTVIGFGKGVAGRCVPYRVGSV